VTKAELIAQAEALEAQAAHVETASYGGSQSGSMVSVVWMVNQLQKRAAALRAEAEGMPVGEAVAWTAYRNGYPGLFFDKPDDELYSGIAPLYLAPPLDERVAERVRELGALLREARGRLSTNAYWKCNELPSLADRIAAELAKGE
jgi:hypothetical protein